MATCKTPYLRKCRKCGSGNWYDATTHYECKDCGTYNHKVKK